MTDIVAPEALKAALETVNLEKQLGASDEEAGLAGIVAGIRANEQRVLERIAVQLETYGREMAAEAELDEDDDGVPEFALALGWAADKVRQEMDLDPSGEYKPEAGDVVEVTIIGEVVIGSKKWNILDDFTGKRFWFPLADGVKPQVRVISLAKEANQVLPEDDN